MQLIKDTLRMRGFREHGIEINPLPCRHLLVKRFEGLERLSFKGVIRNLGIDGSVIG